MALPLSRPSLRRQDFDYVLDAMVHDRLSSGEITKQLARDVGQAWGTKETLVCASVADGLRHVLRGLGLAPGDEVVVSALAPPYWVPALQQAGLVPVLADVLPQSPVLDVAALAPLRERVRVVVADACLGYLPDVAALQHAGWVVIEDVSHGLGGQRDGHVAGTRGDAVVAAFAPETLVAGAGGAIVAFRKAPVVETALAPWEALSDLGASLILSQWKDAALLASKKREHFRHLFHRLPRGYHQPKQEGDAELVSPWFPLMVEAGAKEVLAYARKKAVEADWAFRHQPHFNADTAADLCPRARAFLFQTLVFPLYSTFSLKELELLGKVISSLP